MTGPGNPIAIVELTARPESIDRLADWYYRAWHSIEGIPHVALVQELEDKLRDPTIGTTFLALDNDLPVGTVSVDRADLPGHDDRSPWLASLYVEASHRGRGLGGQLVRHALHFARGAGHRELHLWTAGRTDCYRAAGFAVTGSAMIRAVPITLMRADLV